MIAGHAGLDQCTKHLQSHERGATVVKRQDCGSYVERPTYILWIQQKLWEEKCLDLRRWSAT